MVPKLPWDKCNAEMTERWAYAYSWPGESVATAIVYERDKCFCRCLVVGRWDNLESWTWWGIIVVMRVYYGRELFDTCSLVTREGHSCPTKCHHVDITMLKNHLELCPISLYCGSGASPIAPHSYEDMSWSHMEPGQSRLKREKGEGKEGS